MSGGLWNGVVSCGLTRLLLPQVLPVWLASQGMAGLTFLVVASTRVVVFIDYQNVQYTARDLFWPEEPPPPRTAGHVGPLRFGQLLCDLGSEHDPSRVLAGVRVYRGQPVAGRSRDRAVRFYDRQVAQWRQSPGVELCSRPLRCHRATDPDGSEYWAGRRAEAESAKPRPHHRRQTLTPT